MAVETAKKALRYIATGPEGILFTDGAKLFMVWNSSTPDMKIAGIEVPRPDEAFASAQCVCGAEVDMRQHDEDEYSDEIYDLGDSVADAVNAFYQGQLKIALAAWDEIRKGQQS